MWSEVFEAQTKKGKDVAILLMDTQGAFDSNRYEADPRGKQISGLFLEDFDVKTFQLYCVRGLYQLGF